MEQLALLHLLMYLLFLLSMLFSVVLYMSLLKHFVRLKNLIDGESQPCEHCGDHSVVPVLNHAHIQFHRTAPHKRH